MRIQVTCDQCKKTYTVADKLAGKQLKCFQCGATLDVPSAAVEDQVPAPLASAPAEGVRASSPDEVWDAALPGAISEVLSDELVGDEDGLGSSDSTVRLRFSGTFTSRMRQELGVIFTAGGPLRFAASHKLMLAVVVLALVAFVAGVLTHHSDAALLALAIGAATAASGFLPRSSRQELRASQIIFYGGAVVLLSAAAYVAVQCYQRSGGNFSWPLAVIGAAVVVSALLGVGVVYYVAGLLPRYGIFEVLAWGYVGTVGLLPLGWDILSAMPATRDALHHANAMLAQSVGPAEEAAAEVAEEPEAEAEAEAPPGETSEREAEMPAESEAQRVDQRPAPPAPAEQPPAPPPPTDVPAEEITKWEVTPDPIPLPRQRVDLQPLELSVDASDILRIMFSAPQAARAVILNKQSDTSSARSSAAANNDVEAPSQKDEDSEGPANDFAEDAQTVTADAPCWVNVFSLLNGRHVGRMKVPRLSQLMDVSLDGKQMIIVTPDRLDVWSLERGRTTSGWRLADRKLSALKWAAFLAPSHLATLDSERNLDVWTLPALKPVYRLENVSLAAVTPGRRYLLTFATGSEDASEGCLREAVSEEVRGDLHRVSLQGDLADHACAFRSDGRRLAVAGAGCLIVWDLRNGAVVCEHEDPNMTNSVRFFDDQDDFLLLDKRLFSPDHRAFVWSYRGCKAGAAIGWERLSGSPDGRTWAVLQHAALATAYLAPVNIPNQRQRQKLLSIHPGEVLEEAVSEISPDTVLNQGTGPKEERLERANWDYTHKVLLDLIAGDDETLQSHMHWFTPDARPCVGLRWGFSVQRASQTNQPTTQPDLATLDDLKNLTGSVGPAIVAGLNERTARGTFGLWPRWGDARFRQVALLRGGKNEDLLAAARRQAVDLLVIASVSQRVIGIAKRIEPVIKLRIVDVSDGRTLWTSKPLSTTRAAAASDSSSSEAGSELVDEILRYVDQELCLKPLPKISPAAAKNRVRNLTAARATARDYWQMLLESRYYQSQEYLTPDEAAAFYDGILGPGKGQIFASGDEAARRELLQEWFSNGEHAR